MMLCVMARRYLAAAVSRPTEACVSTDRQRALADHLASCAGCRSEKERLGRLLTLLADATPSVRLDAELFNQRLMAAIQQRRKSAAGAPSHSPGWAVPGLAGDKSFSWAGFRPATMLPALCLMLAAGGMALYLSGQAIPGGSTRLAGSRVTSPASPDEYQDSLRPPREVPFSVEEDLVGTRRGTIPLTTYVLEPAPQDAPVILASF